MKKAMLFLGLVGLVLTQFACTETCLECVKCHSFYSNGNIANSVEQCNNDSLYREAYKEGFLLGAEEAGRTALCFDHGTVCRTKREWKKAGY